MRSAVDCILTIYKGADILSILHSVGHYNLHILAHKMNRLIERSLLKVVVYKVQEAILRLIFNSVEQYGNALVKVAVVLNHCLHILHIITVVLIELRICHIPYKSAILPVCRKAAPLLQKVAL